MRVHPLLIATVYGVTARMTDEEVTSFYNAASQGCVWPFVLGYSKGRALLTEAGGTETTPEVVRALRIVIRERQKMEATS